MGYLQWQRTADLAAHASRYISRCLPPHRPALGPAFARSLGRRGRLAPGGLDPIITARSYS